MSFAYTPGYAFLDSGNAETQQTFSSGDQIHDLYGVDEIQITKDFLTVHFTDADHKTTWREAIENVTFYRSDTDDIQPWEVLNQELTSSEEYEVNTTHNYIHYRLSDIVGSQANANLMAEDLATNGTNSSILDIAFVLDNNIVLNNNFFNAQTIDLDDNDDPNWAASIFNADLDTTVENTFDPVQLS